MFGRMIRTSRPCPALAFRFLGIAVVYLLTPISVWSEEESLPGAEDGQEVIVGRIAGLSLSHGLPGVAPDYRECGRVDSFDSEGGERLEIMGTVHYAMKFRVTVSYQADCQWQLSDYEIPDQRAFETGVRAAAAAAAEAAATAGVPEAATFGYQAGSSGTQDEPEGEIVFWVVGSRLGCGWYPRWCVRMARVRDRQFRPVSGLSSPTC